jgi:hypothetical protein
MRRRRQAAHGDGLTNLKAGEVTVIDMKTWEVVKRIPTRGPGSSCAATKTAATPSSTR